MRLSRQKLDREELELNMAPMIDVVFLLLIFFMCTSSFEKAENEVSTGLPVVGISTKALPDDFEPILIAVGFKRGSGLSIVANGFACRSFQELHDRLRLLREINDSPVTIDAIGKVEFGYMIRAYDTARNAEFSRVAFAATTRIRVAGG